MISLSQSFRTGLTASFLFTVMASIGHADLTALLPMRDGVLEPFQAIVTSVKLGEAGDRGGLKGGDIIETVDDRRPREVFDLVNMIQEASGTVRLQGKRNSQPLSLTIPLPEKRTRLKASLFGQPPRLGAQFEAMPVAPLVVSSGPFVVSAKAFIDEAFAYVRVKVQNNSTSPITVSAGTFTAADGERVLLKAMPAQAVVYASHGNVALRAGQAQSEAALNQGIANSISANATYTTHATAYSAGRFTSVHATSAPDFGSSLASAIANGMAASAAAEARATIDAADLDILAADSQELTATVVEPSFAVEGVLYFARPRTIPFTLIARLEHYRVLLVFSHDQYFAQLLSGGPDAYSPGLAAAGQSFGQKTRITDGSKVKITLLGGRIYEGVINRHNKEFLYICPLSGCLLNEQALRIRDVQTLTNIE